MKKAYSFVFIYILTMCCCYAQQLQQIEHPPSKEIYDLLVDRKGFLWVAHDLGVSCYDGISFTSFTNAAQTAISMTDLVEDNYGRIWCHNFNGQIFYIQNEKMYYLKEYDFKQEASFPRMVLYGDDLIATSSRGLFICNTANLKCKYLIDTGLNKSLSFYFGITCLCVIKHTVLAYSVNNRWYTYDKKNGLRVLKAVALDFNKYSANLIKLQPKAFRDTALLLDNPEQVLYGLTIKGDSLVQVFKKKITQNILTTNVVNGQLWINTAGGSFQLYGNDKISNYDVTSIVKDNEGNRWFGSLTYGLYVSFKPTGWYKVKPKFSVPDDFMRTIGRTKSEIIMCSQHGEIFTTKVNNPGGLTQVGSIALLNGSPDKIQTAAPNKVFIETSKNVYLFNASKHVCKVVEKNFNAKDIAFSDNTAFLAGSNQLIVKNKADLDLPYKNMFRLQSLSNNLFFDYVEAFRSRPFKKKGRCRAVLFDSSSGTMLAAFSDGLLRIDSTSATPILFDNNPLYVSSLTSYHDKIYAGTFNNGLFEIRGKVIKKISDDSESQLNAIVKIKCCNNHIWVFRTSDIEVINAQNDRFTKEILPLPVYPTDITDVEEDDNEIILASHSGLFAFLFSAGDISKLGGNIFLRYVLANNKDTINKNDVVLPNNENNLLFRLAIPIYENADQVNFKYHLTSTSDSLAANNDWYFTQSSQRDIQFNALTPGSYYLTIIAIRNNSAISSIPFIYHFSIQQPWYNTIWFYCSLVLFSALVFWALYQYRLRQVFKIERIRRKISNDLHDDIGSTLSSINVYSQLAKSSSGNSEYINTIQSSTIDIINNLDDLVWNINPKNDILQQLLNRMQLFALPLLEEKGIECIFKIKVEDGGLLVSPDLRANIFLLFKEIINNAVKHSNASVCNINIIQKNKMFRLIINDNGKGFDTKNIKTHRNGLQSMAQRAKDMKGEIAINSLPNAGTEIKLNCYIK